MTTIDFSEVYNQFANEYDVWFEKHPNLYQSELLAMKQAIPQNKTGIEIGVGSGRFAEPLNIKWSGTVREYGCIGKTERCRSN